MPADPDAVTGRKEGSAHITTEEDLGLPVINVEVCRGVEIVRRDQFQPVAADDKLAALIRNADQFGVEGAIVADEALPQAGNVPLKFVVARVP